MTIERKSDKWISLTQSALLHAVVVGALAYGFYAYKTREPQEQTTLALEAAAVDSAGAPIEAPSQPEPPPPEPEPVPEPEPQQEPPPPPPEEQGPPAPTPEEIQQREEAQRQEQQRLEQERAEQERIALERRQAEEKAAAEEKARREEAERKRKEEEQRRLAEERRKAEEKRKADEERRRREQLAREQAEREAELRRSLEAEERRMAARTSDAYAAWTNQIIARVKRAWIRPPTTPVGLTCTVRMSQTSGGEVVGVEIGECNGDAVVQESIRSAVFKASPLPPPPDPSLFERNITFVFRHNE